jgi:hypothetical protein
VYADTYRTLTNRDGHFLGPQGLRKAVSEGKIDVREARKAMFVSFKMWKLLGKYVNK